MIENKITKIRISIGSAAKLGLLKLKMNIEPTNLHLLTYNSNGCSANCAFCPQSKYTHENYLNKINEQKYLSRIVWPSYDFNTILESLKNICHSNEKNNVFKRICIQSLNYSGFEQDVIYIIKSIKEICNLPISISVPPVNRDFIKQFKEIGLDRICFAMDCANEEIFTKIKGSGNEGLYNWYDHLNHLKMAVDIFGKYKVTTHLIIGLGETEYEALKFIYDMKKIGILTGLFSFYPIKYTKLANLQQPPLISYRKIQLGKYLIDKNLEVIQNFIFDSNGVLIKFNISLETLKDICIEGKAFQTSGCPGCNRPYYTSSPKSIQYNFARPLNQKEKDQIYNDLEKFCNKIY